MSKNSDQDRRRLRRAVVWGSLGAVMPLVASIAIVEGDVIADALKSADGYMLAGYCARAAALLAIGAIWAVLQKSEVEPLKLFQLGIVAPAMITGMISASSARDARMGESGQRAAIEFSLFRSAHASQIRDFQKEESPVDRFIRGVMGRPRP